MELDPREHDRSSVYRMMTNAVVPRPIGWISTRSPSGVDNLAPYSYFNAVSSHPPVVMFSAGRKDGEPKDTPTNAIESEEFVYNIVTEPLAAKMDESSATIDADESEFDAAGIERAAAETVDVSRVANSPISMECTVMDSMPVYDNTVVFGEVQYVHIDDEILTDGKIDARKVDAVGRLGGPFYTAVDIMDLERSH